MPLVLAQGSVVIYDIVIGIIDHIKLENEVQKDWAS